MHFMWTLKKAGNVAAWSLASLSFTGCLVTSVPKHPTDVLYDQLDCDYCAQFEPLSQAVQPWDGVDEDENFAGGFDPIYAAGNECEYGPGLPLPLPAIPLPNCFSRWHTKATLPQAPPRPRFHPLPTRPIFSPAVASESGRTAPLELGN